MNHNIKPFEVNLKAKIIQVIPLITEMFYLMWHMELLCRKAQLVHIAVNRSKYWMARKIT